MKIRTKEVPVACRMKFACDIPGSLLPDYAAAKCVDKGKETSINNYYRPRYDKFFQEGQVSMNILQQDHPDKIPQIVHLRF